MEWSSFVHTNLEETELCNCCEHACHSFQECGELNLLFEIEFDGGRCTLVADVSSTSRNPILNKLSETRTTMRISPQSCRICKPAQLSSGRILVRFIALMLSNGFEIIPIQLLVIARLICSRLTRYITYHISVFESYRMRNSLSNKITPNVPGMEIANWYRSTRWRVPAFWSDFQSPFVCIPYHFRLYLVSCCPTWHELSCQLSASNAALPMCTTMLKVPKRARSISCSLQIFIDSKAPTANFETEVMQAHLLTGIMVISKPISTFSAILPINKNITKKYLPRCIRLSPVSKTLKSSSPTLKLATEAKVILMITLTWLSVPSSSELHCDFQVPNFSFTLKRWMHWPLSTALSDLTSLLQTDNTF